MKEKMCKNNQKHVTCWVCSMTLCSAAIFHRSLLASSCAIVLFFASSEALCASARACCCFLISSNLAAEVQPILSDMNLSDPYTAIHALPHVTTGIQKPMASIGIEISAQAVYESTVRATKTNRTGNRERQRREICPAPLTLLDDSEEKQSCFVLLTCSILQSYPCCQTDTGTLGDQFTTSQWQEAWRDVLRDPHRLSEVSGRPASSVTVAWHT